MSQQSRSGILTYQGVPLWRDVRVLRAVTQIVSAVVVITLVVFFVRNVLGSAERRGLALGFDFLNEAAGFPIAESVIPYHESDSFQFAFWIGILNTLKVALVGILLATVLGTILGVSRISSNWLISKIASTYIEIIRNVPLLIQLFFWYFAVFQKLPRVQESIPWPGPVYLSNRGVYMVWAKPSPTFRNWMFFVLAGLVLATVLGFVLTRYQMRTGRSTYPLLSAGIVLFLIPALGWVMIDQSPLIWEAPSLGRFNFQGGLHVTPEFAALLAGLVIYTASFIAEIVRAGIMAVPRGQVEAARAVGLSNLQTLRLVTLPQAMRVIIPPLISQYLNLTKNSSLAIAIGYPDLFSVGRIMINQGGRAVPTFIMIMAAYLAMSLTYAIIGNIYNRRMRFAER